MPEPRPANAANASRRIDELGERTGRRARRLQRVVVAKARAAPARARTASPAAITAFQAASDSPRIRIATSSQRTTFTVPLAASGTPFQRAVWGALLTIPFGHTCSYGQLAQQLGQPTAGRAVGAANGRNPIAVIVPCHRVIGANGTLTGYAGGLAIKEWLLTHERAQRPLRLGAA